MDTKGHKRIGYEKRRRSQNNHSAQPHVRCGRVNTRSILTSLRVLDFDLSVRIGGSQTMSLCRFIVPSNCNCDSFDHTILSISCLASANLSRMILQNFTHLPKSMSVSAGTYRYCAWYGRRFSWCMILPHLMSATALCLMFFYWLEQVIELLIFYIMVLACLVGLYDGNPLHCESRRNVTIKDCLNCLLLWRWGTEPLQVCIHSLLSPL